MKGQPLWKISVVTAPEAEEALTELISARLGSPVASYHDLEAGNSTITAYLDQPPDNWRQLRQELREALERVRDCGLETRPGRISAGRVRHEDWAESWKRHFKPIAIGRRLLIRPGWVRRPALPGQRVVVLNPGLSFGTGQHPTTSFCLREVVAGEGAHASLLDAGTGSGILAIAAAKLGYERVSAFDNDPEAVRVALANARQNRAAARLEIRRGDVRKFRAPKKGYTVVCANLISNLLLEQTERIVSWVAPGGQLVLAGILRTEFPGVRRAFEAAGLRLLRSRAEKEWESGSFAGR
jgi:ribosomal protein L11 methyltransferase